MIQYTLSTNRTGAIGALLNEYGKAMAELITVIQPITNDQLVKIADPFTRDDNCLSIQTILTHVVYAGYGYATSIGNLHGPQKKRPPEQPLNTVDAYCTALESVFLSTEYILSQMTDAGLEQTKNKLKIKTSWGQCYDTEQMMEHAIVHILRHRRQAQNMLKLL